MGNVQAASSSPSSANSGGTTVPPPPPLTAPPPVEAKAAPENKDTSQNPGNFEELHKKCKDVFPQPMEGYKLMVNKGLSNHFQVSHSIALSAVGPGAYHFAATYVGSKQTGPNESYPVLLGDIDTTGSLNAQIIHQFTDRIRGKCVIQTQKSTWVLVQADSEYQGKDFTANLTVGNLDLINESGIIVAHYLQRLAPKLDLGAELLYHYGSGQEIAVMSLAGRYSASNWIGTATVGQAGWHLSYWHKGNENVQVGVEYEYNMRAKESAVSLGYQMNIPKANVTFRGMVDTNWTVAAVMEKRLLPLPFTFVLSGMVNHLKNQSRFGFGLTIG
ncbi:predicted protein [Nematostella vectensis]|uniref:Mitochondrial import receptor subunit TOM40 homolog n=1 Tax=Nematostella vectensis TaxID=45351 RepID=A7S6J4_NEMVE|nr:predicted protein [Nematostella vectensis]|eukprot:XP_001632723.1 predicted protein [Nematostella vectensis]